MSDEERYDEAREVVFTEFEKTLDLETALALVPLRAEEVERIRQDPELEARLDRCKANRLSEIIEGISNIAFGDDVREGVRLSALEKLGRVLRPDKFRDNVSVEGDVTYVVLPREEKS